MKYATLTLLSSLSTALLAATSLLWLRSHTLTDDITWHTAPTASLTRTTRFRTSGGGFWFETRTHPSPSTPHTEWHQYPDKSAYPFAPSPTSPLHERLGFLASTDGYDLLLVAPYWSLAALAAPLPLLWARATHRRLQRRSRRRRGLCEQCAYDLRASPAACPECGRPVLHRHS